MAADWRLPLLAVAAWVGAWCGLVGGRSGLLVPLVVLVCGALGFAWRLRAVPGRAGALLRGRWPTWLRWVAVAVLVATVLGFLAAVRVEGVDRRVVSALAEQPRAVVFEGTIASDVKPMRSRFGDRARVTVAVGRAGWAANGGAQGWQVRDRLVLTADAFGPEARLGAGVRFTAVPIQPAATSSSSGQRYTLWALQGEQLVLTRGPDLWWRAAEQVRGSIRAVVADRPDVQRALVPSLVVGDDSAVSPEVADAFRTTGLTHLLAVSGTNLTLLMGVVLGLATRCGLRGRGRIVLALGCVLLFVLVARSEPSVVRAATMGTVALFALERNAVGRGVRCLALAVLVILVWDPFMARSAGLALSVLATGGILLLAPVWAAALEHWLPRWAALCVAVPAAAQVAVTPVVTLLQGEISLVAVVANMAAAPAVAPATVLGLAGGLVGLVHPGVGSLLALPAAWAVGWIAQVAAWGAGLPLPALPWSNGPGWLLLLCVATLLAVVVAPPLLRRWWVVLPCTIVLLWVVFTGVRTPGWPPPGWVMAACDVGQGDALVLRTGEHQAVVVDAGPEPMALERCLDRLDVREIPLVVLTHFHADHVDGLPGVLRGRRVGAIEVSPVSDPPASAAQVTTWAAEAGVPIRVSEVESTTQVGEATLHRIWPSQRQVSTAGGEDAANDASIVLWAEIGGVTLLLTGDIEPPAQRSVARRLAGTRVDVLKVPHHGSRHQEFRLLEALAPKIAVVSAGAGNSYGHPAPELIGAILDVGASVLRTDTTGDVAVVRVEGGLATASRVR